MVAHPAPFDGLPFHILPAHDEDAFRSSLAAYLTDPTARELHAGPGVVAIIFQPEDSELSDEQIVTRVIEALKTPEDSTKRTAVRRIHQATKCSSEQDVEQWRMGVLKITDLGVYMALLKLVADLDAELADHLKRRIIARRTNGRR